MLENTVTSVVKNAEASVFIDVFAELSDWLHRIVCIRVQWNHSDLAGCTPGGGVLGGWLLGKWGWVQL